MGFGGIVAGAIAGGAQAWSDDIVLHQKEEMERIRQERLAQLTLTNQKAMVDYNVKSTNDNAATATANEVSRQNALTPGIVNRAQQERQAQFDIEAGKPVNVPNGTRLVNPKDGKVIVDSQEAKLTTEQADLVQQRVEESKAREQAYRAKAELDDRKPGTTGDPNKLQKNDLANFKDVKGEDGKANGVQFDDNTRISRKWVNGVDPEPAKPGTDLWLFKFGDKPAAEGKPGYYQYFDESQKAVSPDEVAKKYPKTVAGKEASAADGASPGASSSAGSFSGVSAKTPNVYANGKNPNDGERIGILKQELADATATGRADNIAAITKEIAGIEKKMGKPAASSGGVPAGATATGKVDGSGNPIYILNGQKFVYKK